MKINQWTQALLVFAWTGWLLAAPAALRAEDDGTNEVTAFVITTWNSGCDANRIDDWDNMIRAWYNEMRNDAPIPDGHGAAAWSIGWLNNNNWIVDSQFVDPERQPWGEDFDFTDVPDAFMAGLHGGNDVNDHRWKGRMKFNEEGPGNCSAYQGDIKLGDGDLEFLHLSSCYSMDREDWWNEWNDSFDGLHEVDGFHGVMYIDSDFARWYRRFADDAFWMSIAESWLDHLYDSPWVDWFRDDQCPVARVVGTDEDDSSDRLHSERYNHLFPDPPGLGQARYHRAMYIRGCSPEGMGELP